MCRLYCCVIENITVTILMLQMNLAPLTPVNSLVNNVRQNLPDILSTFAEGKFLYNLLKITAPFQKDRVLCVVLVNISWAEPPSLIKFHSINNKLNLTNHVGFRKILIFWQTDRFLLEDDE